LLFGGSAASDFKLKPLLICDLENPRALEGKAKGMLPVIGRSDLSAWVTETIFQDWFSLHFVSEIRQYCSRNNLAFKAILLSGSASGHPQLSQDLYPETEVFLPVSTTLEIQPMDQTVVATFKHVLHEENN
jgi:hypothetical protein